VRARRNGAATIGFGECQVWSYRPLRPLPLPGLCPPFRIRREPRETRSQRVAALADRTPRVSSAPPMPPTVIVLAITTIPISDSVPCHTKPDRARRSARPNS
jgi:hypothetical protein